MNEGDKENDIIETRGMQTTEADELDDNFQNYQ